MKQTNKDIENLILKNFLEEINKQIASNMDKIRPNLFPIIYNSIFDCPEMASIRGGSLRLDLGINFDPTDSIATAVANSTQVEFKKFSNSNNNIKGGVFINVQPTSFDNLNIPSSVVITEEGQSLPWLDWMLNYGDNIIITTFGVSYQRGGRSGGAIMVPNIRPFRIDPVFSGTPNNNFISRALNRNLAAIEGKIWQSILS